MKRIASLLLTVVMMLTTLSCLNVSAASEIFYDGEYHTYTGNFFKLMINDKKIDCSVPPIVFNDYSVVPARDVFEQLGATVLWNASTEQVTINYENTKIVLYINKKTAYKNGVVERMPIVPKIINGKTMIPARYVSESLGFDVKFDSATDTISIKTPEKTKPVYTSRLMSYTISEKNETFSASFNLSSAKVDYSHYALTGPDRIVVDIKGTDRAITIKDTECESLIVTKIRIGQHDDGVRVVFDLPETFKYKVTMSGKTLTVLIGKDIDKNTPITPSNPGNEDKPEENIPPKEIVDIEPSRSITIDAGHGGSDPGAVYIDEDGTIWRETDINLAVALKVRDILKKKGVRVVMTRTTEADVVRRDRPELANSEETALFISIHTNSVEGSDVANGIETWGSLETSLALNGVTDKSFAQNVQDAVIDATGAKDRGIKDSVDLTVLVYSVMPSILVEVGFITNTEEREKMFSESYRNKLAEGIAEGILKTFDDMGV